MMKRILLAVLLVLLLAQQAAAGSKPTLANMQVYIDDDATYTDGSDATPPMLLGDAPKHPSDNLPLIQPGQYMTFDFDVSYGADFSNGGSILFVSQWDWPYSLFGFDYSCWYYDNYGNLPTKKPVHTFLPFDSNILDTNVEYPYKFTTGENLPPHLTITLPVMGEHPLILSRPESGRHKIVAGYTEKDYPNVTSPDGILYTYPTDVHFENTSHGYSSVWPANLLDKSEVTVADALVVTPPVQCLADLYQPFDLNAPKYPWLNLLDCVNVYGVPNAGAIPGETTYNTAFKLKNTADSDFSGYIKLSTPCKSERRAQEAVSDCPSYGYTLSTYYPVSIPAGGEKTLRFEDICGVEKCTLTDAYTYPVDDPVKGLNNTYIYIKDSRGQWLMSNVYTTSNQASCSEGAYVFFGFYNPKFGGYAPYHCVKYNAAGAEGAPLKTDKGLYAPGDSGTVYVGWYGESGAAPFLPIKAGSKFRVRIYKIDDFGAKAGAPVAEVESMVPSDVTVKGQQQNYYIPFTYNGAEVLSQFVLESEMYEPDGTTIIRWINNSGYCTSSPLYFTSNTYAVKTLYCAPGSADCGCAASTSNTSIGGRAGKAKRFECSRAALLETANYIGIMDFNARYSSASVTENFLNFVSLDPSTGIESAEVTDITASQHDVRGNIGIPVVTEPPPMHNKRYVVYLAPDVSADSIMVPSEFVAGIPAAISALVTNTGFLNIGTGTGSEGIDNLRVKMDYGDGSAPDTVSNLTNTTVLQTGMSLLADKTHAFPNVGTYTITATADPAASPDLIVEGDENNNVISDDVVARPACSTVFCDNSFTEVLPADAGAGCAPCADVPEYPCIDPANYVCYNGNTSPDCGGAGSALAGCPACSECVDGLDCESGLFCDGGICVASASAGPSAVLSATKSTQTLVDFTYECKDPQKGSASGCAATPGCITSCELDIDTDGTAEGLFGSAAPLSGDAVVSGTFSHDYAPLGLGTYTATLTTTPCAGLPATATYTVQIGSNNWPTAEIITPANSATFNEGTAVTLTGRGSDVEDKPSDLSYVWKIDGAIVEGGKLMPPGTDAPGEWGNAAPYSTTMLTPGPHTITLEVTDLGLAGPPVEPPATGSASVTVEIIPALGDVSVKSLNYSTVISKGASGTFKAVIANTNTDAKSVNVTLSISGPGGYAYACPAQNVAITGSNTAEVSCDAGSFDALGSYTFKAKINSCVAVPCNRLASNDSKSGYFTVIQTQAIAVPELPLLFAVLAALAVVAILNRRK